MKTIAAVQIEHKSQLTISNIDLDEPRADEVLVKIIACGICHTDIMMQADNSDLPFLLGHEGSGIIEKVGSNIASFSPGDAVLLSYTSCGHCQSCIVNRPYQCESLYEPFFLGYREDGTTHAFYKGQPLPTLIGQGSFAKHVVVHRSSLVKVDSSLDLRTIAPLGCGFMTGAGAVINYLKPKAGMSILICGMGAVGFGALVAARQSGCSNIIAVDRIENRLQMAKEFGATHTIDTSKTVDLVFEIKSVCGALDFGYDSTGNPAILSAMSQSLHANAIACGVGGGVLKGFNWQTIDEGFAVPQELIPKMIDWYNSGNFPIEKLVKFYPFENVNEAMTAMRNGTVIKPILVM